MGYRLKDTLRYVASQGFGEEDMTAQDIMAASKKRSVPMRNSAILGDLTTAVL